MELSDKKSIQQLVLSMAALGLRHVVISPGSRNAPLIISFHQQPEIHCISVRDERSAGFFALGKALELDEPVALLCTSGSAALNYAPAISEAYYQRIPLIVITADRPFEWTDQGDGQTIRQTAVYHQYIRKSYRLEGDTEKEDTLWYNRRCISEGFIIATKADPGPVHFNVHLGEPLYRSDEADLAMLRVFTSPTVETRLDKEEIKRLQSDFYRSEKVMILVGQRRPAPRLSTLLAKLAAYKNTIILCESTSNIKHPDFIENIDRCIVSMDTEELPDFMPDLLITIGGAVVSKKIKALLRKYPPAQHWNVHPHDACMDTYKALTRAIPLKADVFFKQLMEKFPAAPQSEYKNRWRNRAKLLEERHQQFIKTTSFSDFLVFSQIFSKIPQRTNLHLANSTPIRYGQLYKNRARVTHCNRGVSGIDGCTSTAMGAASCRPDQKYVLVTGDVGFFYDRNAFWNENIPKNINIIVINNSGGSIFRIIEGPSQTKELEEYFETKHHYSAKELVEFYEWGYLYANDERSLTVALDDFFKPETRKTVLEVFTPNEWNAQLLASYFNYLKLN